MIVFPLNWQATDTDMQRPYPVDNYEQATEAVYWRAIDIQAPVANVYRWLCQLQVAPYSYDWLDNGGRKSPEKLTPGAEQLKVGQAIMTIFQLVEFVPNEHLTLRMLDPRRVKLFGDVLITYAVFEKSARESRLVVKIRVSYPKSVLGFAMRCLLPWGDLFMMHKQFLTFRRLAERTAQEHTKQTMTVPN